MIRGESVTCPLGENIQRSRRAAWLLSIGSGQRLGPGAETLAADIPLFCLRIGHLDLAPVECC